MTHSLTQDQIASLQECLALAHEPAQQDDAKQRFSNLIKTLELNGAASEIVDALWNDLLAARRSTAFWQQISDAEKGMSERLAENHFQLQQNYLRLMQEQ